MDASAAGEGTLELVVSTREGSVRAEESIRARGVYNVTFLPTQAVPHFVSITFNDEDVPGTTLRHKIINQQYYKLCMQTLITQLELLYKIIPEKLVNFSAY